LAKEKNSLGEEGQDDLLMCGMTPGEALEQSPISGRNARRLREIIRGQRG
jgi:hypothetical protein